MAEEARTIKFITGDVTSPQGEGLKIVAHVCNDVNGFGSGVAGAIAKKWYGVKLAYHDWHSRGENFALGMVQFVTICDDIIVANMIAQHGYSYAGHPAVQYPALRMCLSKVAKKAKELEASIHMPRICCGLGGMIWDNIEPIITDTVGEIAVIVYDLPDVLID